MNIIRKLRLKRGLTQERLAELAGISVGSVQNAERGDGGAYALVAIAEALQVDVNTLEEEEGGSDDTTRES